MGYEDGELGRGVYWNMVVEERGWRGALEGEGDVGEGAWVERWAVVWEMNEGGY